MSIEAMKRWLEALEYHTQQTRPIAKTNEAIVELRQAIKQAQKQEPVACSMCKEWEAVCDQHLRHIKKLKKQRQWVGLTDEEIKASCELHTNWFAISKDLEAKLKEKNT